jgi:nucleotide-binding universal stress UspA family protein
MAEHLDSLGRKLNNGGEGLFLGGCSVEGSNCLIAANEGWDVRTLTVSKNKRFGPGYKGAAQKAKTYLEKRGIAVEQFFLTGDPVTTFVNFAGRDHLVIMGASTANPLKKLIFGSKPIKTLERLDGPVLIVK